MVGFFSSRKGYKVYHHSVKKYQDTIFWPYRPALMSGSFLYK